MTNYDELSVEELEAHKTEIDRALTKAKMRQRQDAEAAVREAAKQFGFSLEELGLSPDKKRKVSSGRSNRPAKFANPEDPAQTWSGLGRQPEWYKSRVEAGHSPDEMRV